MALSSNALITAARQQDFADRAVIATDRSGTIVYWNDQAAALYRCPADDAVGKNLADVASSLPPLTSERNIIAHMQADRGWTGEFLVQRGDGTAMVMNVTTIAVHAGGEAIGTVGVLFLDSRNATSTSR